VPENITLPWMFYQDWYVSIALTPF